MFGINWYRSRTASDTHQKFYQVLFHWREKPINTAHSKLRVFRTPWGKTGIIFPTAQVGKLEKINKQIRAESTETDGGEDRNYNFWLPAFRFHRCSVWFWLENHISPLCHQPLPLVPLWGKEMRGEVTVTPENRLVRRLTPLQTTLSHSNNPVSQRIFQAFHTFCITQVCVWRFCRSTFITTSSLARTY